MNAEKCTCTESFGQLVYDKNCDIHIPCPEAMRGIPIQCILTENHEGMHR